MYMEECCMSLTLVEAFSRATEQSNRYDGLESKRKGNLTENRLKRALERVTSNMRWVHDIRLATKEEDATGKDVVIYTSIGKLYFQAKSSRPSAYQFRRRRPRAIVVVVAVPEDMHEKKLENKSYTALMRLRRHILRIRRRQI